MTRTRIGTILVGAAMMLGSGTAMLAQDTAPVYTGATSAKEARPATTGRAPLAIEGPGRPKPTLPTGSTKLAVPTEAPVKKIAVSPTDLRGRNVVLAGTPNPLQPASAHAPASNEKAPDHPETPKAPEPPHLQQPPDPPQMMSAEKTEVPSDGAAARQIEEQPTAPGIHAVAPTDTRVKDGPSAEEARRRAEAGAAIPRTGTHPAHLYGAQVAAQAQATEAARKQSLIADLAATVQEQTHKTTTSPNGDRITQYPDQSEVRYTAVTGAIEVRYPDGENGFIQKTDGTRTPLPSGTYPSRITPPAPVSTLTSLWNAASDVVSAIPNPLDYVPNPGQAASAAGGVVKGAFDALCGIGHAAGAVVVGGTAQWCGADPNGYFGDAMRSLDRLAEGTITVAENPRLIYQAPVQTFDRAIDRGDAFGAGKVVGETGTNAVIVADAVVNLGRATINTVRGTAAVPETAAAGESAAAATADAAVSGERSLVAAATADAGTAAEGAAGLSRPLNVIGEAGPGVTRAHLEAVQQLANQTGRKIIVLGSRQTGIRASTGGRFTAASDIDLGVVGTADDLLALVRAEEAVLAIPNVEHGVMALQPTIEAALSKGWIVVVPW